jgi:transcriptional regulator with XRE-family HTH domain
MRAARSRKGMQDERYRELIGQLLRARQDLAISQQELARRLGRDQQFVSRYELGERRLDVVEFADIARTLGLEPDRLLSELPRGLGSR